MSEDSAVNLDIIQGRNWRLYAAVLACVFVALIGILFMAPFTTSNDTVLGAKDTATLEQIARSLEGIRSDIAMRIEIERSAAFAAQLKAHQALLATEGTAKSVMPEKP